MDPDSEEPAVDGNMGRVMEEDSIKQTTGMVFDFHPRLVEGEESEEDGVIREPGDGALEHRPHLRRLVSPMIVHLHVDQTAVTQP